MNQIIGKKLVSREKGWLMEKMQSYQRVCLDIGCGDGKWTYRYAQENSDMLVIGIDADSVSLEKVSHKANRKPAKGGVENLVFVKAFAEDLPTELTGIANHIFINFPWGSLLAGVMTAQPDFLSELTKVASAGCALTITTTYNQKYEPQMIESLNLPELTTEVKHTLEAGWKQYGWKLLKWERVAAEGEENSIPFPQTSWWKQISAERERQVWQAELCQKL